MPIPKHDDIRVPVLQLLVDGHPRKSKEFELPLAKHFKLSDQEVQQEYESGNGRIFYDRVSWALSYLNMSGLVTKPKRGLYQISEAGRNILENPAKIHKYISAKLKEREPSRKNSNTKPPLIWLAEPHHLESIALLLNTLVSDEYWGYLLIDNKCATFWAYQIDPRAVFIPSDSRAD
ncbi:MAG: winged helix-turn-helix domain-containing protein [Candidatus Marinimicrobia bacterium]|nr:winged helix-turn-helix domain-containing protein [Candidatus Neomarinimicrobiota bacterium]